MNRPPLNKGIDLDKPVVCKACGTEYMCTPWSDYYGATCNTDGECESCLLRAAGLNKIVTVIVDDQKESGT